MILQFRILGKVESNGKPLDKIMNIDTKKFVKDFGVAATQENIRRRLVEAMLADGIIVSDIQVPSTKQ